MTDLEILSSDVIALQNQLRAASLRALEIITVTDGELAEEQAGKTQVGGVERQTAAWRGMSPAARLGRRRNNAYADGGNDGSQQSPGRGSHAPEFDPLGS